MKRKRNQLFVTALTAAMAVSLLSPAEPAAAAKKVKFNVKKLSLTVGKKKTLKIKNAKKKAKWSIKSGKDKIKLQKKKKASVVVAAKKAGSAKVQAKVGKKKYVCKVVVKAKTVKNGTSAGTKTTNKPADTKNATKNPSNGQNNAATQPTNNPSNGQNNAATQPTNNPSKDNPSKDNPANPTATPAADPDVPKKNEQDVKKLQALIRTLNQKGADISANLDDESVYHWNKEGRLTEIYWGEKEIIGAEMADFNEFTALEILDINNNNISGTFYVGDLANLKELKCYGNKIDKLVLDTNKNLQELDCHNNQISNTIRLNDSKNLERLYCSNNKITELDVSGCDKLQDVDCSNNLMSSLNVSDLPSLKSLNCSRNMLKDDNLILTGSIGLINLNLAGFTKLESLNCSEQPEDGGTSADDTMEFDISACTGLKTLNCSYCSIETLDVSNLSNLETIDASGCNLSEITLDGAVKLSSLNINCNEITDLHIPETNEIKTLDCSESLGIETINFAVLTKLESLDVSDSYVPELDFSICPDLQVLNAMNTGFGNPDATTDNEDLPNIDIDLKSNAKLKDIDMSMVNVNVLTLPENDIVANLSVSDSAVTQIVNLEKQLGLETLNIARTGISALDLSANTNLKQVSCTESQKTGITGVDEGIIYNVPDDSDDGEDGNEDGDDGEDGNEDGDVELE